MNGNDIIPKKIHYCWFGGKDIPAQYGEYIKSWQKFFPDYEIIRWDESNFNLDSCKYVRQAYDNKYWAFVSDYARFKILYEEGGIYFDVDVEVIKTLSDIIVKGSYMGFEMDLWGNVSVASGLGLAFPSKNLFVKKILDYYENRDFLINGHPDTNNNVCVIVTEILKDKGLNVKTNEIQVVDGVYIYPSDYFCPIDFFSHKTNITHNTRTIHHYADTWGSEYEKENNENVSKFIKFFGRKMGPRVWYICNIPRFAIKKIKGLWMR